MRRARCDIRTIFGVLSKELTWSIRNFLWPPHFPPQYSEISPVGELVGELVGEVVSQAEDSEHGCCAGTGSY